MATSVFDRQREPRGRGCPLCGAKSTVRIGLTIQELVKGKGGVGKSVGRSLSMCPEHGEELFLRLEADVEKMRRPSVGL